MRSARLPGSSEPVMSPRCDGCARPGAWPSPAPRAQAARSDRRRCPWPAARPAASPRTCRDRCSTPVHRCRCRRRDRAPASSRPVQRRSRASDCWSGCARRRRPTPSASASPPRRCARSARQCTRASNSPCFFDPRHHRHAVLAAGLFDLERRFGQVDVQRNVEFRRQLGARPQDLRRARIRRVRRNGRHDAAECPFQRVMNSRARASESSKLAASGGGKLQHRLRTQRHADQRRRPSRRRLPRSSTCPRSRSCPTGSSPRSPGSCRARQNPAGRTARSTGIM